MAVNIYEMTDTWNNGATAFTAIQMNVTDTASAAGSLLLDLQVGGVSKFKVNKAGQVFGPVGLAIDAASSFGALTVGGLNQFVWASGSCRTVGTFGIGGTDIVLARDAANTLAQRNGANAQTFNLYNTYTDASNYERGFMKWNANVLEIGTEAAGTGTRRNIVLDGANRGAHIADPTGGVTTDAEARTAINAILVALENHGLVATS